MTELRPTCRILQFVPETLPSHRHDVQTLFGEALPLHGVLCDIVGKADEAVAGTVNWPARCIRVPSHGPRWRTELRYLGTTLRTLLTVSKTETDFILVRDMVGIGFLASLIGRLRGIPVLYWISYLITEGRIERCTTLGAQMGRLRHALVLSKARIEYALLYRLVLPACAHVFVQSERMQSYITGQGVPAAKITPVPMGIKPEAILAPEIAAQRLAGCEGVPIIAYLGILERLRELEKLVDILHLVRQQIPGTRLLLIGDSPQAADVERIRQRAAELGLSDAIHITGWLPSTAAWALLKGADVAVSPIPRSPILDVSSPTKILEYLALGMPCVGNDSPDQAKVIRESGAARLADWTPQAFAAALIELLRDLPAARQQAAGGWPYLQAERTYDKLAARVAAVFQQLHREARR